MKINKKDKNKLMDNCFNWMGLNNRRNINLDRNRNNFFKNRIN